ncbi:MAG: 50S ribosomal protein L15 [Chloroflexi bacterium]|nr:MAG: 50S ribosomal protein L15 [Chloroflexota bacterium]
MKLHELKPAPGAKKKRKRLARGNAGRGGTYAGRGRKGQKARSGGKVPPYFEGGQLPLVRRLPFKRGFTNIWRKAFTPINVDQLEERFAAGSTVSPPTLVAAGLIKRQDELVKILGRGELKTALTVRAHAFSKSAREKIEAAGGTVELIAEDESRKS